MLCLRGIDDQPHSLLELFKQAGLAPSVRAAAEGAAVVQESDDMDYADDSDLKMNR